MHESNPKGVLSSVPHKTGHVGTHLHLRGRGRIESLRSSSATHWVWSQLGPLRSCLIKIKTSHTTTTTKKRELEGWLNGSGDPSSILNSHIEQLKITLSGTAGDPLLSSDLGIHMYEHKHLYRYLPNIVLDNTIPVNKR